jgi:hypothetical protein
MTTEQTGVDLPELPAPRFKGVARGGLLCEDGYSAEQMQQYVRDALARHLADQPAAPDMRTYWMRDAAAKLGEAGHSVHSTALYALAEGIERGRVVNAPARPDAQDDGIDRAIQAANRVRDGLNKMRDGLVTLRDMKPAQPAAQDASEISDRLYAKETGFSREDGLWAFARPAAQSGYSKLDSTPHKGVAYSQPAAQDAGAVVSYDVILSATKKAAREIHNGRGWGVLNVRELEYIAGAVMQALSGVTPPPAAAVDAEAIREIVERYVGKTSHIAKYIAEDIAALTQPSGAGRKEGE